MEYCLLCRNTPQVSGTVWVGGITHFILDETAHIGNLAVKPLVCTVTLGKTWSHRLCAISGDCLTSNARVLCGMSMLGADFCRGPF